jgi:SAM-dependent methyltransferase
MLKQLVNVKKRQDFNPGFLGLFINPFFIARKALWKAIQEVAPDLQGDLLDVGCGRKPYKKLFNVSSYTGMDIENPGHSHQGEDIDVFYDGKTFPFQDNAFDSILCNQVLEHVFNPESFLKEINRVLKPGGKILLSVPFVWDEHEQPFDYARYSTFGLNHLFNNAGLEIVKHKKTVNNMGVVFQLMAVYIYKLIVSKSGVLNMLTNIIFITPITLGGLFWGLVLPSGTDFYLDHVVIAVKK